MIVIRHTNQTRDVYENIFEGTQIHQMDSFFLWIGSLLHLSEGKILVDIATGRGQMVNFAHKLGAVAYGFDFSFTACQIAQKTSPRMILCADALNLPFENYFADFITNLGSLEHFEDMDSAIKETVRILKPDGTACFVVPNTFGLRWNVQYAWRTGDVDDDGQPLQRYGTRMQWSELFISNGLKISKVLGYEHNQAFPRTRNDFIEYLKHPKRMISMLMNPYTIPVNAAGQLVFLCSHQDRNERGLE